MQYGKKEGNKRYIRKQEIKLPTENMTDYVGGGKLLELLGEFSKVVSNKINIKEPINSLAMSTCTLKLNSIPNC